MKILWFTINPSGATELLNPMEPHGGWMSSLEKELVKIQNIELSVCFYWNSEIDEFKYNNVNYYPIYKSNCNTKLKRYFNRITNYHNDIHEINLLLDVVKKVNPDLIHIHGAEENFGLIQKYISNKTVISIQSILSSYLYKYYSGIPKSVTLINEGVKNKLLLKTALYNYKLTKRNAIRELDIYKHTKYIIGRTKWDCRISRLLSPESKYFIVNEMLRDSFYKKKWVKNEYDEKFKIITTMSSGLYKGLETIVQTCQVLIKNNFKNFKWTVVGQSESSELSILVRNWFKIDYCDLNIELVGLKTENELVELLINSDLYCQVSHIENSPNSVCEAMLLGMPIIASFVGGTDSLMENNVDGILLQDGDPYSYGGAILEISNDFTKAITYAHNARQKALVRHNQASIINDLLEAYNSILKNKM